MNLKSTTIGISGFYENGIYDVDTENYRKKVFSGKPEFDFSNVESGKKCFPRIQMSANNYGHNHTFEKNLTAEKDKYSFAAVHELGHYLIDLYDEYLYFEFDDSGNLVDKHSCTRPDDAPERGMMENVRSDLEMSSSSDYDYITGSSSPVPDENTTGQWCIYGKSCEDTLAELITTGSVSSTSFSKFPTYKEQLFDFTSPYAASYTKRDKRRRAAYDYAALVIRDEDNNVVKDNIVDLTDPGNWTESPVSDHASSVMDPYDKMIPSTDTLADLTVTADGDNLTINAVPRTGSETYIYIRKPDGDTGYTVSEIPVSDGKAQISLANGASCELVVVVKDGVRYLGNNYTLERSFHSDKGYSFMSADSTVMGTVVPGEKDEYTFLNMSTSCREGEYSSVNHAVRITSASQAEAEGIIISAASADSEIDYSSISWFKEDGDHWKKLDTTVVQEENLTLTAACGYEGDGTYVLMAKPAADTDLNVVTDLLFTEDPERDAAGSLTFNDSNPDIEYYDLYVSDTPFTSDSLSTAERARYSAGEGAFQISFPERDKDYYVAAAAVAEDGSVSGLSEVLEVRSNTADRDGDGIPDWYCDQYSLWPSAGVEKNIADSDDDRDGLTNLEEYHSGSDPTNPYDPYTVKPVESVRIEEGDVTMSPGETVTISAVVIPADAGNRNVSWYVDDGDVVKITPDGSQCLLEALSDGTTKVYAVTEDGGFSAGIQVTVGKGVKPEGEDPEEKDPEGEEDTGGEGKRRESEIPEVTEEVFYMTAEEASGYLGLTKKEVSAEGTEDTMICCTREESSAYDGSSYLEYYEKDRNEEGLWNLTITDDTISFEGITVGMKEASVEKLLNKEEWTFRTKETDQAITEERLWYTGNRINGEEQELCIVMNKGWLTEINYFTIDD